MYFPKNSRYVLKRAKCMTSTFCLFDCLKGTTRSLCAKPPIDDPTKPPLRLNIPDEQIKPRDFRCSSTQNHSRINKHEVTKPRSKSLLPPSNSKQQFESNFDDGFLHVTKSKSDTQTSSYQREALQSGTDPELSISRNEYLTQTINASDNERSSDQRFSKWDFKQEKSYQLRNSEVNHEDNQADESSLSKFDNPSGGQAGSSSDGNNYESKALYIIVDVPEKQATDELNNAESSDVGTATFLKLDIDSTKSEFGNNLSIKVPKLEWQGNESSIHNILRERTQSQPNLLYRSSESKQNQKIKFQVHEIDEAATYVFHLRFKKNFPGKSCVVGCVPEKELTMRTGSVTEGEGQVRSASIPNRNYKEITKMEDRMEPTKYTPPQPQRSKREKKEPVDRAQYKSRFARKGNSATGTRRKTKDKNEMSTSGKEISYETSRTPAVEKPSKDEQGDESKYFTYPKISKQSSPADIHHRVLYQNYEHVAAHESQSAETNTEYESSQQYNSEPVQPPASAKPVEPQFYQYPQPSSKATNAEVVSVNSQEPVNNYEREEITESQQQYLEPIFADDKKQSNNQEQSTKDQTVAVSVLPLNKESAKNEEITKGKEEVSESQSPINEQPTKPELGTKNEQKLEAPDVTLDNKQTVKSSESKKVELEIEEVPPLSNKFRNSKVEQILQEKVIQSIKSERNPPNKPKIVSDRAINLPKMGNQTLKQENHMSKFKVIEKPTEKPPQVKDTQVSEEKVSKVPDSDKYYTVPQNENKSKSSDNVPTETQTPPDKTTGPKFKKTSGQKKKTTEKGESKSEPKVGGKGYKFSSNETSRREVKDPVNFQTSASVVNISSESPSHVMRFCAAYPPTLNAVMTGRGKGLGLRKQDGLLQSNVNKINFSSNDYETNSPEQDDMKGLSENSILFPKKENKKFVCDSLFNCNSHASASVERDANSPRISDNIVNVANEDLTKQKGKPSVDSLALMKKVKEIVNLDLNNAVKIFEGGETEGEQISSVVTVKGDVWQVDKMKLEKCMAKCSSDKCNLACDGQAMEIDKVRKSLIYLPGRDNSGLSVKLNSVITYNQNYETYGINQTDLDAAIRKSKESFRDSYEVAATTIANDPKDKKQRGRNPGITFAVSLRDRIKSLNLEMKSGDSILVFDEVTQTWKVDYSILEKREEQLKHEKELTERSELILETIEKLEKSHIKSIPKPNSREKKIFDYTSEEWKAYKPDEVATEKKNVTKLKQPFKESDAEEIRKKNSDLYEDLFVSNKKETKSSKMKERQEAPSGFRTTQKLMTTSKESESHGTGTPTKKNPELPAKDTEKKEESSLNKKKHDDNFWETFLNTNILPFDRPEPPKPVVPPPSPPSGPPPIGDKKPDLTKVKVPPPTNQKKKIDEPKYRISFPFTWDRKIDPKKTPTGDKVETPKGPSKDSNVPKEGPITPTGGKKRETPPKAPLVKEPSLKKKDTPPKTTEGSKPKTPTIPLKPSWPTVKNEKKTGVKPTTPPSTPIKPNATKPKDEEKTGGKPATPATIPLKPSFPIIKDEKKTGVKPTTPPTTPLKPSLPTGKEEKKTDVQPTTPPPAPSKTNITIPKDEGKTNTKPIQPPVTPLKPTILPPKEEKKTEITPTPQPSDKPKSENPFEDITLEPGFPRYPPLRPKPNLPPAKTPTPSSPKKPESPPAVKDPPSTPPQRRVDPREKQPPTIGSPSSQQSNVKVLKDPGSGEKGNLKTKSAEGKKEKVPSDHYVSKNIVEMSKNVSKDVNSKGKSKKGETVKVNILPDKRMPSKVTEINLNKKFDGAGTESESTTKNPKSKDKKKPEDDKSVNENNTFYKKFEKYKTPFSDLEYEEKSMKINSDMESNPNLKKLENWNKTLVLHEVGKPQENIETWLKDETDKMATLLLKVLQEAAEGKPKKSGPGKSKSCERTQAKGNPYDNIRKKQETTPENLMLKMRSVNMTLEAEKKSKMAETAKEKEQQNIKDIPVQSAKNVKPPRVVDAVKVTSKKMASEQGKEDLFADSKPKVVNLTLEPVESGTGDHPKLVGELTDDIPGPEILKKISNTWKLFPLLGCQLTIFTLLRMFQLVNLGTSLLPIQNSDKSRRHAFGKLFVKYGPIVNLQGPLSGNVILIHKPEHLMAVFEQDGLSPPRSVFDSLERSRRDVEDKILTTGVSTDWGKPEWNNLRKACQEPTVGTCDKFLSPLEAAGDSLVSMVIRNKNGQNFASEDFIEEIRRWSLEGLCNALFERPLGFLEGRSSNANWHLEPDKLCLAVAEATECLVKCERGFQIWRLMGTPSLAGLGQAYRSLSTIISKQLCQAELNLKNKNKQIKEISSGGNLAELTYLESMLLFDGMTHEEATCNLIDVLVVGSNVMSSALGFLLYHLAHNVKVQQRLFNEVKEILPEKNSRLNYQKLQSQKFLQACLKESLRLNTPFPLFFRLLQNDILLSNYVVPKGTYVVMDSRISCMKEQVFDEPDKFIPERWLNEDKWMHNAHSFSSFPLCHGPKSELTKRIVEMQLCSCLAKMIRNFEIEYHFGEILGTDNVISFPNKPLKFNFIERSN